MTQATYTATITGPAGGEWTVTVPGFRAVRVEIIARVEAGEEIVLSRAGRPIAKIVPVDTDHG